MALELTNMLYTKVIVYHNDSIVQHKPMGILGLPEARETSHGQLEISAMADNSAATIKCMSISMHEKNTNTMCLIVYMCSLTSAMMV